MLNLKDRFLHYTVDYKRVVESYRFPYTIKPLNILSTFAFIAPGSLLIAYACINGWQESNDPGAPLNWQGPLGVILFLVFGFISLGMIVIEEKHWATYKHPKEYYVDGLKPEYQDLPIYKEAINDVISEIKAGVFEEGRWNFYDLNDQARRFQNKQQELNKANMPVKDYAQAFKDFNDQYFGEEEKPIRKLTRKSAD